MPETTLTFLGTSAVLPEPGRDTACLLINKTLLVDCGWSAALGMRAFGFDAADVETLYFTHCHHDHYMGLPALLFYRSMRAKRPLRMIGPPDDLPLVVDLTRAFLQAERFPTVWPQLALEPLEPGSSSEGEGWRIDTLRALHPVTGVSSRFTDLRTGASIAFSGDTGPNEAFAQLARGADVMIHEASIPPEVADDALRGDHSRAVDAARAARDTGVQRLFLIHLPETHRRQSLAAAREVFPSTDLAEEGLAITLPGGPNR